MSNFSLRCGFFSGLALLGGLTFSSPVQAFSLSGYGTTGDDMNGMAITVDYLGGGSQTAIWKTTGLYAGGAFGSGWSLSLAGDTFSAPWRLVTQAGFTQAIAALRINAIPGNTVFDIDSKAILTPGSAYGHPFTVLSGQAPTAFAYATDIADAQADLKGVLSLNWSNGFLGTMSFRADTDNGTASDPVRAATAVPEPTTIAGLTLAAAGLMGMRRRRPA